MSREKTTTRTIETNTKTNTKRVTSLDTKSGAHLSALEESVVRMHHGISLMPQAPLATHGGNEEVMAQLLEMEVRAFEKTERVFDLEDIPQGRSNAQTARIVDKLKSRA